MYKNYINQLPNSHKYYLVLSWKRKNTQETDYHFF